MTQRRVIRHYTDDPPFDALPFDSTLRSIVDATNRVQRTRVADVWHALGNRGNQERLLVSDGHVRPGVRGQLRLATTLCGKETQRDHLAFAGVEAVSRIVVAETIVGQPLVDVAGLFRIGLCEAAHAFTENLDLFGLARLGTSFRRSGALRFERQMHIGGAKEVVELFQER